MDAVVNNVWQIASGLRTVVYAMAALSVVSTACGILFGVASWKQVGLAFACVLIAASAGVIIAAAGGRVGGGF